MSIDTDPLQVKLKKNRESASKSRRKKKELVMNTQKDFDTLQTTNAKLKHNVSLIIYW